MDWVINVTSCDGDWSVILPENLVRVSSVFINDWGNSDSWEDQSIKRVLDVPVNGAKDPKLVRVPRTPLDAGLYEFAIVMNDGRVLRQYQNFVEPFTIVADFKDFVGISIYPVPVKGREFAVDFDLQMPMDIDLTIIDNMGQTRFFKELHFPEAGKNKIVVPMEGAWHTGLYHVIFQYKDGSSNTLNFTVVE